MSRRRTCRDHIDHAAECLDLLAVDRLDAWELWCRRHFIERARRSLDEARRMLDGLEGAGEPRFDRLSDPPHQRSALSA